MTDAVPVAQLEGDHTKAVRDVLFTFGRSVYLYQQIEVSLKTLLPYIKHTNGPIPDDPFAEMKLLLESRETMGPLFERLKNSMEATHPESLANYLEQVVNNRNELIHSFLKLPFGNLASMTSCREALSCLESRHRFAEPLMQLLRELLSTFVSLMNENDLEISGVRTAHGNEP